MIRFFISLFLDKIISDVSKNITNVTLDSVKLKQNMLKKENQNKQN
jgi:hypothetical protein